MRLPLEPGITAIIGPNGSGKSNITDAVAWALGEQRSSALRAEAMGDVIFSGSEALPGAAVAEVTLVLDNSNGNISLPYREVSITRKVTRSGDSEYRLNGARMRMQDIRAVAGEAGIGQHSILRQGAVDAILSGGAAACRDALEEAAGLGVYRRRRLAALRRLERATEQLSRSQEIEQELSAQLKRIQREAIAAREYRDIEARFRALSLAYLHRLAVHATEEKDRSLKKQELDARELSQKEQALRERRSGIQHQIHDLDLRMREVDPMMDALETGVETLRVELLRGEKIASLLESIKGRYERREQMKAHLEAEVKRLAFDLEGLELEVAGLEHAYSQAREDLTAAEVRVREKGVRHDAASTRRMQLLEEERNLLDRKKKLTRLTGERSVPGVDEIAVLEDLRQRLDEILSNNQVMEGLESLFKQSTQYQQAVEVLNSKIRRRHGALLELTGRAEANVRVLQDTLQDNESTSGYRMRLQDYIRAKPGYEAAVEAALGELTEGILVEDLSMGAELISNGERVAVRLDAQKAHESGGAIGRPLIECVEVVGEELSEPVERLLSGIYVVEGPEQAENINGWIAVTHQGVRITRTSISHGSTEGEFIRRARLDRELQRLKALKGDLYHELSSMRDGISSTARQIEVLRVDVNSTISISQRVSQAAARLILSIERKLQEARMAGERVAEQEEGLKALEGRLRSVTEELQLAAEVESRCKEELESAGLAAEDASRGVQGVTERLAEQRFKLEEGRRRRSALVKEIAHLQRLAGLDLMSQHKISRGAMKTGGMIMELLADRMAETRQLREELSGHLRQLREEQDDVIQETLKLTETLAVSRSRADKLREELSQVRDRALKAREEMISEWGATYEEAAAFSESLPDNIEPERMQLATRLKKFGDVNLLAISQEKEVRERYEFIKTQRADAETAAGDLKRIIQTIDEELKSSFHRILDQVSEKFYEIIPRMIPGARGTLKSHEEGVEIGVRLHKKGYRPLHALSGGERSLLALSYLFSIYLARPGAFCILDEAEAALDDLNLARFLAVLDSHKMDGQFILVTHQKRTMAAAEVLYGVTVDTSGASAVVSKRLSSS